jgi:putative flippase GtrA
MALLIQVGYARDWRASAIASAVAVLHNYLLNNHWTFRLVTGAGTVEHWSMERSCIFP